MSFIETINNLFQESLKSAKALLDLAKDLLQHAWQNIVEILQDAPSYDNAWRIYCYFYESKYPGYGKVLDELKEELYKEHHRPPIYLQIREQSADPYCRILQQCVKEVSYDAWRPGMSNEYRVVASQEGTLLDKATLKEWILKTYNDYYAKRK